MPRNRVRDVHHGARPGSSPPALRLGAAPWNETGGARHVRDHGVNRTEKDGAEADRYRSSSSPRRYLKLSYIAFLSVHSVDTNPIQSSSRKI
ncbi:unnamed protein product [Musa hybrid cultivar]